MSERSFLARLGQHISFVYNQIGLYPLQSTIIAFNIIFAVGGAIACRRCYIKSRVDDALVEPAKIRKRRKKYERLEKSSSSDSSERQSTVIVDIESSDTDSEPFRQKHQPRKKSDDTSSDSDVEESSTASSVSDTAVTIDIDSSESSDESEKPVPTFHSPKKSYKDPRGRSPYTHCSKLALKKTSSCTQTKGVEKSGKKTTGTQTGPKRNSSTQTTNKMENCDCNDDSNNDSELSWYHAIQRFRKPNMISPPILTGRYKKYSHINKHPYSHDARGDTKAYKKKGGKKTIFGVALKPVCNSDGDERQLSRSFDPNLTNFSVSPRVK